MILNTWFLFLPFALLATLSPGPAVLYVVTNTIEHGWRKTIYAPLGNAIGICLVGVVAISGLGTLIKASPQAYQVIRYMGASYLIYMGCANLLGKNKNTNIAGKVAASPLKVFMQAFGIAISNPKAFVFMTALLPQFINLDNSILLQFLILITTLSVLSITALIGYSLLAHKVKRWLTSPGKLKIFKYISSSLFIIMGLLFLFI